MSTPAEIVQIELTQGQFALVDAADAELVGRYKWFAMRRETRRHGKHYTYGFLAATKLAGQNVQLHVFLARPGPGLVVDHINGDTLDCRRANLRVCTHQQNRINSNRASHNKSGFMGVSWHAGKGRWAASLTASDRSVHIGWFGTAEDAARARDAAAYEWAGQYARLNFPKAGAISASSDVVERDLPKVEVRDSSSLARSRY